MDTLNTPALLSTSITQKIQRLMIFGFCVLLLLMGVIAGSAYYNIYSMEKSLETIIDENNLATQYTYRLGSIARERSIILNRIVNEPDPFIRDEDVLRYSELAGEFIEQRLELEELIKTQQGKQYLKELKDTLNKTQASHENVIALVRMNEIDKALVKIPLALQEQQRVISVLEKMMIYQQQLNQDVEEATLADFEKSYAVLLGTTFLFILIGGLTGVFVVKMNNEQHKELVALNSVLQKSNESLEAATKSAKNANKLRSEFIANMSHELRTPMTSIKGSLGMLNSGMFSDLDKEILNLIKIADENVDSLMHLISDILDFSKIEAGDVEIIPREVDIRQDIDRMILPFKLRADKENINLIVNIEDEIPQTISVDFEHLSKTLSPLLDNAFKFTDEGDITVEVSQVAGEKQMQIIITDSGCGIKHEDLDKIFDNFVQGDGSSTRKYGGTGLGLSISKKIVEAMGGTIGVESVQGKGSSFWLTLPLVKLDKAA